MTVGPGRAMPRRRLEGRAWTALLVATLGATLTVAGCGVAPIASEAATASLRATVSPSMAGLTAPAPAPPGTALVTVPEAGIALPVPDGWRQVSAADLADPAIRQDLATRYPGTGSLLEAAEAMGDRAEIAFLAVDPAAQRTGTVPASIAVLVSQPSVSGLLLELVSGFISDGFQDVLGAGEPDRDRVGTPLGRAVRLAFALPSSEPSEALAWVVGAPAGTLLVSVMGPTSVLDSFDPDALMAATTAVP